MENTLNLSDREKKAVQRCMDRLITILSSVDNNSKNDFMIGGAFYNKQNQRIDFVLTIKREHNDSKTKNQ